MPPEKKTKQKKLHAASAPSSLVYIMDKLFRPGTEITDYLYFIFCYRRWFTSGELLLYLLSQFSKMKEMKKLKCVQFAYLWISRCFELDFHRSSSYPQLLKLLEKVAEFSQQHANRIKLLILRKSHELAIVCATKDLSFMTTGSVLWDKSKMMRQLTPKALAEQMTLLDDVIFKNVCTSELHYCVWLKEQKDEKSPNVARAVKQFNDVSTSIASDIIMHSEMSDRVKVIIKWIIVGKNCRRLNNFNALMEIVGAFNLWAISRLPDWAYLPKKYGTLLSRLKSLVDPSNNFKTLRSVLERRKTIVLTEGTPCIPYLGLYLNDLNLIENGNTDFTQKKGTILRETRKTRTAQVTNETIITKDIINIEKVRYLGKIFQEIQIFQSGSYERRYDIRRNEEILQYFMSPVLLTEDRINMLSETIREFKHDGNLNSFLLSDESEDSEVISYSTTDVDDSDSYAKLAAGSPD